MEIDNLKGIWKAHYSGAELEFSYRKKIREIITRSRKAIWKNFILELVVVSALYVGFAILVVLVGRQIQPFFYKMVLVVTIFTTPIYLQIYRSLRFISKIDYSTDIRTNLTKFLIHYKLSLHFYRWGTYLLVLTLLIIFYFDNSFLNLDFWIKASIIGFLALIVVLVGPLVNKFYGNKIISIESFLSD